MRVYQHHPDGKRSISIGFGGVLACDEVGQGDVVLHDASGVVVHDSKAERIKENTKFIDSLMPKLGGSPHLMAQQCG